MNEDTSKVDEEFRAYRSSGLALSATAIGFASVLAAWGLSIYKAPSTAPPLFYFQVAPLLGTIMSAFFVQAFHYEGAKHRARTGTGQSTESLANAWFLRADRAVHFTEFFLAWGLLASIALWFCGVRVT